MILANSYESTTECMRKLLNNSEVHAILSEAISDGGEAVVARYLHDFAHMTYIPQGDDELEVTVDYNSEKCSLRSYVVNIYKQMREERTMPFAHEKGYVQSESCTLCFHL